MRKLLIVLTLAMILTGCSCGPTSNSVTEFVEAEAKEQSPCCERAKLILDRVERVVDMITQKCAEECQGQHCYKKEPCYERARALLVLKTAQQIVSFWCGSRYEGFVLTEPPMSLHDIKKELKALQAINKKFEPKSALPQHMDEDRGILPDDLLEVIEDLEQPNYGLRFTDYPTALPDSDDWFMFAQNPMIQGERGLFLVEKDDLVSVFDMTGTFEYGVSDSLNIVNSIAQPILTITATGIEVESISGHPISSSSILMDGFISLNTSGGGGVRSIIGGSTVLNVTISYVEQRSAGTRFTRNYGANTSPLPGWCSTSLSGSTYFDMTGIGTQCVCDTAGVWQSLGPGTDCT